MRLFAILLTVVLICGCSTHTASHNNSPVQLIAVVRAIEPLDETRQDILCAQPDAHFALVLHVISAGPTGGLWKPEVVFAIHSPAKFFAADAREVIGKRFEFAYRGREGGFPCLEVIRQIQ